MLISKLVFIAALGLTAAAYPAGRADDTGFDASIALRSDKTTIPRPGGYDSSQSGSQTGQRRPKTKSPKNSKRDGPHPPHVNPSKAPGPQRIGNGGSRGPSSPSRLLPGAVPGDPPRQYTKRHEGHYSEQLQSPPSGPSSKPGSTGNSRDDHSGASGRPDREQSGHTKSDDHEHDHNRSGKDSKDSKDSKDKDGEGSGRKDDKPGRNGKGNGSKHDEASPTSKPSTPMPSKSVESTASVVPTPSASLKPDSLAESGY